VVSMEKRYNTDLPFVMVQKLDKLLRFFDGDLTMTELLSLDTPSQRALVQARLENLRKSQQAFEKGRVDMFTRRYTTTLINGPGDNGGNDSPSPDKTPKPRNFRATPIGGK
jgi:hypothetical protein